MRTRTLGATGPAVSTLALGAMSMSGSYGAADRDESIATIHAALDAGINLIDTGDFYGMGHNELLIRDALRTAGRDQVNLSVKFGALRGPDTTWGGIDNRPAAVRNFLGYTLTRLGTDHVDIYRPARLDPAVPVEETIGALSELVQAGYVRHVGLSEVDAATIRRAHAVHPIADLQVEYSVISREPEGEVLDTLRELGIGMTAYGVLSRGLISGHWTATRQWEPGDFRSFSPRFSAENVAHNVSLAESLRPLAESRGATVAQLAIAWVLAQDPGIVPLIGARTRTRLSESLGALNVELTADDLAEIEKAVPRGAARGDRYPASVSTAR
ncbi:aldo/keto reductase [Dactylosporangium sp. CA-233914]|uniref:aldo/keto reductase n=1 Tax=Dactylosporangium sp. CA-233914 TaxID=3239934 RepID=UPI003D935A59